MTGRGRSMRSQRANRLWIDEALGQVSQLLVGRTLFLQGLLEQLRGERVSECLGVSAGGAVVGDLQVLDALRRRNQPRVANVAIALLNKCASRRSRMTAAYEDRQPRSCRGRLDVVGRRTVRTTVPSSVACRERRGAQ